MEETIELREYFDIIRKRLWIVALITVISILISAGVSYFILNPLYETSTTLMVNKGKTEQAHMINYEDVMLNQKLVITYGEIVKSRAVLDKVMHNLNLHTEYEDFYKKVNVTPVKDTEIMNITVQNNDPHMATKIANEIPKVFTQEVIRITKADSVQVIDKARLPQEPIKPRPLLNIVIAAVLGFMLGLFVIFVMEYMDNTIKTPQDIEKYLEMPVIGVIPKFVDENK